MADFPHTLGLQAQKQAQALIKALGKSGVHLRWRTTSGKTPLEINNVLNSFAYSVAGQCYDETQVQRYVQLVSKIGFEKTKLAAETPIGSVYCMPIDAVAYRRWKPKSKEHLTVFVSEGIMPDGRFLVSTITHTPLRSKNNLVVKHIDYPGVDSISYIPCDSNYQYTVSINELHDRLKSRGRYGSLPTKECAYKVQSYRPDRLNKLLLTLNKSGSIYTPLCIMDGGTNYGISREVSASNVLPKEVANAGLLGLRYDYTNSREVNRARETLEELYKQSGTPAKFVEAYKHYADLPLSYARYEVGLDTSSENILKSTNDLCSYLKVSIENQEKIHKYLASIPNIPSHNLLYIVEYGGSQIPLAFDFSKLQIQHGGSMPDLRNPAEREKIRYLLESCPKDVDESLYLKQFAGRDVLTDYEHTKPIADPKLLELYGQFPVKEMSQIPLQNVNDFLSYLKENDLSAQDVGQITSQMVKNLTTPGTICKEQGIAEYLKLNTITDTNSLEHIEEISHHMGKNIDNGLDCVMHKGDTLSSLMPPLNPINVIGNFIDL